MPRLQRFLPMCTDSRARCDVWQKDQVNLMTDSKVLTRGNFVVRVAGHLSPLTALYVDAASMDNVRHEKCIKSYDL